MAITEAKKNWWDRMFPPSDKSRYKQQEDPNGTPAPVAGNPSGFVPDYLPSYLGKPTVSQPGQAAPVAPNPAVNPGAAPTAVAEAQPNSRYKLYELMQAKPERDVEGETVIRNRAKMNAISKGLSGLAGLAGMAKGGYAPEVPDMVTPWNMQELQVMDQDHRRQLEDWTNKGFQVDQMNTQTLNREIDQTIDAENRAGLENQQANNNQILAEQKAQYALKQLQAKSQEEQIKEMEAMGINPYGEDAYSQYLKAQKNKYDAELGYTKARTNWNNRITGSSAKQTFSPEQLAVYQRNRNAMIAAEQAKLQGLDNFKDAEKIKAINERIKQLYGTNPGANELTDMEMMDYGQGGGSPAAQQGQPAAQVGFDPQRGFTNVPRNDDPMVKGRLQTNFQKAFTGELTENELSQMIQDLILTGDAPDEESAYQMIEEFINENQQ